MIAHHEVDIHADSQKSPEKFDYIEHFVQEDLGHKRKEKEEAHIRSDAAIRHYLAQ